MFLRKAPTEGNYAWPPNLSNSPGISIHMLKKRIHTIIKNEISPE